MHLSCPVGLDGAQAASSARLGKAARPVDGLYLPVCFVHLLIEPADRQEIRFHERLALQAIKSRLKMHNCSAMYRVLANDHDSLCMH